MVGFIIINKPEGFTSFDVVAKLRKITGEKKIGHAGTLDPMATGVLLAFLGKATRAISLIGNRDKEYKAGFQLGVQTDTLDRTGQIVRQTPSSVGRFELQEALSHYRGDILQTPPMYSAVKVGGKKLYSLARKGIEIKRQKRRVTIHALRLLSFDEATQQGELLISCSEGTYVRSLCSDIGEHLGVGATTTSLLRTKACGYSLEDSVTLAQVEKGDYRLREIKELFSDLPVVSLNDAQVRMFSNGRQLSVSFLKGVPKEGMCAVYGDQQFLGIAKREADLLMIIKNFS